MRRLLERAPLDPRMNPGEHRFPPLVVMLLADLPLPREGYLGDRQPRRIDPSQLTLAWSRWAPLIEAANEHGLASARLLGEPCSAGELLEDYEDAPPDKSGLRMSLHNVRHGALFGGIPVALLVIDLEVELPPPILERLARAVDAHACPTILRVARVEETRARLATLRGGEWVFAVDDPMALAARTVERFVRSGFASPDDPDAPPPSELATDFTLAMMAGRLASWAGLWAQWSRSAPRAQRPTMLAALHASVPPDRLGWIDEEGRAIGTPLRAAGFRVLETAISSSLVELAMDVELWGRVHERRYAFRVEHP